MDRYSADSKAGTMLSSTLSRGFSNATLPSVSETSTLYAPPPQYSSSSSTRYSETYKAPEQQAGLEPAREAQPGLEHASQSQPEPSQFQPPRPQQRESSFPEDLPARPYKGQSQSSRAQLRSCYICSFWPSYSPRHNPDKKTRWRQVVMILLLIMATAFALFDTMILVFNTENQGYFAAAFVVLDVLLLWPLAWSLALIGDAVGPRKLFRFTVGRKFFDAVLFTAVALYVLFFILVWVAIFLWGFQIGWLVITLLIIAMGFVAKAPKHSPGDV
ncbi:hypothetical protein BDY17DRAFT_60423 [Neohortaea acidophila]|uniref:Uncharacterized protein n=1 Tax=Neohortaea acidophila TaxID=245834 RepID=A0A6A6PFU5_9PEZI|nr:uncharacterized protein BDY17DRAFT_60423 [Neohortaea acidophila]KAF2478848.1 hypothetical protein BDY17DRAFT_60423 [Neohortaea acidophila]